MPKRFPWLVSAIALAVCAMVVPGALYAQFGQSTGSIIGKVVDEQAGVLPGVSVIVKGPGAPVTVYTDARGEFRVTNIDAGMYTLTVSLQGFSTVNRENVVVQLGKNTELTIPMKLSAVAATVTVTGEAPILETKRVATGAQISQQELSSIPTARDPWVILQSAPGVQMDRINVAGSESGQQSNFRSNGSSYGTFAVDGVNFTDMTVIGTNSGGSAAYYDFDSFQEMQVITGGTDASIQGSGSHLNMVTKRGTNEVHGSARLYETDHHFQSNNLPDNAPINGIASGNHINSITDTGVEVGGPVLKDTLWLWGSYGRSQINLVTANGLLDRTTLEDFNGKLNWQIVPSNAFDAWYLRSDKLKFGRNAGPTRLQPTSWDQTTPGNNWKVEDSQIVGSNLFLTAQYNGSNGNFTLYPEGGIATQSFLDENGVWHNTYLYGQSPRPQRQVKGDVSYFFNTGSIGNELKAGFGYLTAQSFSQSTWAGDGSGGLAAQTYGDLSDCAGPCATITRQGNSHIKNTYYNAYLQDAITMDRLTVNLGVRWDRQYGDNLPTTIGGNPSFPQILPTIDYPGQTKPFGTWNDWQPRVGLTYALGAHRDTVFKASYARYAEVLGTGQTGVTNPTSTISYAYYAWHDGNGCAGAADNFVQPCEVDLGNFLNHRGYDPANPGAAVSPNIWAPGFHAPKTDEIVAGVDHELFPAFAVGVVYTYRKFNDLIFRSPTGVTSADYTQYRTVSGTLPDGTPYSAPVYELTSCLNNPATCSVPAGYTYTNRSDYHQTYNGVDLVLTKRLSNKWMMRGSFTWNTNKQHVGSNGCVDPTNTVPGQSADSGNPQTLYTGASCADGSTVAIRSTGSGAKDSVFLNSKWQFNVNGLYQLPLNFNIAGSVYGRQGYPIDWYVRTVGDDGYVRDVAVSSLDDQRYQDVYEVDLRLEKVIPITTTANVTVSADCFNVTNQNTILQQFNRLNRSNTGNIKEIQSPRIWRFGARISF